MENTKSFRQALVRLEKCLAADGRDIEEVRAALWKEMELVDDTLSLLRAHADDMRCQFSLERTKRQEVEQRYLELCKSISGKTP